MALCVLQYFYSLYIFTLHSNYQHDKAHYQTFPNIAAILADAGKAKGYENLCEHMNIIFLEVSFADKITDMNTVPRVFISRC